MPLDLRQEEDQKKLLAALLLLTRRLEQDIQAQLRPYLLVQMRRVRQLILQLPPEGILRSYQWRQIERELRPIYRSLTRYLGTLLEPLLQELEPLVLDRASRFARVPPPETVIRRRPILDSLEVTGHTVVEQLGLGENQGRMASKLAQETNARVQRGLLIEQLPTLAIAESILGTRTVRGVSVPTLRKGSFASLVNNRLRNVITAATWQFVNRSTRRVFENAEVETWIWDAILDPKTCPVCRPLDRQIRSSPDDFPYQPPVHPQCRCVILPVLAR